MLLYTDLIRSRGLFCGFVVYDCNLGGNSPYTVDLAIEWIVSPTNCHLGSTGAGELILVSSGSESRPSSAAA